PPAMHGYPLTAVKMLSATAGWIAAGPKAFEFDGVAWIDRSAGLAADLTVTRLAPLAAGNVWASGVRDTHSPSTYRYSPVLLHWDGAQWATVPAQLGPGDFLNDITMSSASDGWAAGWVDVVGEAPLL